MHVAVRKPRHDQFSRPIQPFLCFHGKIPAAEGPDVFDDAILYFHSLAAAHCPVREQHRGICNKQIKHSFLLLVRLFP